MTSADNARAQQQPMIIHRAASALRGAIELPLALGMAALLSAASSMDDSVGILPFVGAALAIAAFWLLALRRALTKEPPVALGQPEDIAMDVTDAAAASTEPVQNTATAEPAAEEVVAATMTRADLRAGKVAAVTDAFAKIHQRHQRVTIAKMVEARVTDDDLISLGMAHPRSRAHILTAVRALEAKQQAEAEGAALARQSAKMAAIPTVAAASYASRSANNRRPRQNTAEINSKTHCSALPTVYKAWQRSADARAKAQTTNKQAQLVAKTAAMINRGNAQFLREQNMDVAIEKVSSQFRNWLWIKDHGTPEEQALLACGYEACTSSSAYHSALVAPGQYSSRPGSTMYYYHIATGKSSWELPADVAAKVRMARVGVARRRVNTAHIHQLREVCAASA